MTTTLRVDERIILPKYRKKGSRLRRLLFRDSLSYSNHQIPRISCLLTSLPGAAHLGSIRTPKMSEYSHGMVMAEEVSDPSWGTVRFWSRPVVEKDHVFTAFGVVLLTNDEMQR